MFMTSHDYSTYYTGLDPVTSGSFATFGWGWHMETAIHALRLILAGIFVYKSFLATGEK
jgi:hypothetical protein